MTAWVTTYFVFPALIIALSGAFGRLWRGPSLPDRLIGLEVISFTVLNALVVYGILHDEPLYLDIGLVIALISFVATISFAQFIEQRGTDDRMD
jgi:multicomponent Na+:H+ antiporter subunit F